MIVCQPSRRTGTGRQIVGRSGPGGRALRLEMHLHEDAEEVHEGRHDRGEDERSDGEVRNSTIRKAAAPMMGGVIWPPVEAVNSTAAAKWRW